MAACVDEKRCRFLKNSALLKRYSEGDGVICSVAPGDEKMQRKFYLDEIPDDMTVMQ